MTEAEARSLAEKIKLLAIEHNQWCDITYRYRGKKLHQVLIKEISIKITK